MEIKLLPKSVRDDLRTGITIRSIAHCIIQLVLNSLDAKSTSIAIRVNLITSKIQVIDNGVGISKTNLKLLGFRYATSKYFSEKELETNQHIFGFKGEALSSIIKLSKIVTVTSKSSASSNTYSKRFENGQLSKITPVNQRPTIGTTIHLEDLMYNMPVRKNHMKLSNCFDEILNEIESIAIIHPRTSFSIRNDSNGEIVFQTYKSKFVYQTAAVLYGKEFSKWLRKIYFLENNFTLNGLIRIQPTQNKIQFIYVNKRLVKKSNIHNCINNLLNKSLIINSTESTKFKYISYIINIKSPKSLYDILDYTDVVIEFKNWDEVLKFIEVGVMKFLKKHQLHKSPKPIKGFDLLIGSPVYADEHTFRASQVRGMIRGLPMKRKLESCSGSSSKMMKINSNSVPKLETPKADLNILELNKVVSQVSSIDSIETINNGKDIIMDIFLKSTAVYGQKDQIDADKSFETASKYTNRSICILTGNEDTNCNELDNNDDNLESQIINNTNSSNNSNAMEMCYNEVINETFTDSNKNQDEPENTLTELKNDNTKIKETNNDYIYNKSETKDVPNAKTDKSNDNSSNLLRNIPKICSLSPINLENQTEWSKSTTLSGNLFYLNDRTGMSSFLTPKSTETYSMSKRYSFMPKGMSQNIIPKSTVTIKSLSPNSKQCLYDTITNSDDYLKKTKWMNFFKTKDSESFFNHLYSDKRYFETTIPSISSSKVSKKVVNALDNFRFSKESINKITIINQWDCKFILAKIFINAETEILVCFDQHAVHERIRLEQLFEDYYQIKNETLKSVNCNVAITLKMGDSDIRMLQNYRLNFENWGFFYKVTQDKCVIFTKIPKCWQSKDDSNVGSNSCLKTLLELLIQEENNWLRNVGHMHTALPLIILNDIKMEACRGAIKFGDTLTKEECSEYIKKLSTCDLPFQCAHGRPTLVPIFNLKETTTKRIMNIKSESTRIEKVT